MAEVKLSDVTEMDLKLDAKAALPDIVISKTTITADNKKQIHEVETPYGPMQVTVEGDLSRACVFTFHDIGLNSESCFVQFFNCAETEPHLMINDLTRVHLTAPGQQYHAPNLAEDVQLIDMAGLVEAIELVRSTLGVERFFGMGVGAGAYLMLSYASFYPNKVVGLCLFGATSRKLGWIEWSKRWMSWFEGQIWGTDDWSKQHYLERWLGWYQETNDLVEFMHNHIDKINQDNLRKFLDGYHDREDITEDLKELCCPLLFFVGDNTPYDNEMVHITSRLLWSRQVYVEQIRVEGTGLLVTEQRPQFVLQPLNLFFKALGYSNEEGPLRRW